MAQKPAIATAWVQVVPSTDGFNNQVERQLGGQLGKTGKKQGANVGKGFMTGFLNSLRANQPTRKDMGLEGLEAEVEGVNKRISQYTEESATRQIKAEAKVEKASAAAGKAIEKYGWTAAQARDKLNDLALAQQELAAVVEETEAELSNLQTELLETEVRLSDMELASRRSAKGMLDSFSPAWAKAITSNINKAFDESVQKNIGNAGFRSGAEYGERFKEGFSNTNITLFAGKQFSKLSGLRAVTDFGSQFGDFLSDVDRNVITLSTIALQFGAISSLAFGATGAVLALGGAFGSMASTALMVPSLVAAGAAGWWIFSTAFKDLEKVLPGVVENYSSLGGVISQSFWDYAAEPFERMANRYFPLISYHLPRITEGFAGWLNALSNTALYEKNIAMISSVLRNIAGFAENAGLGIGHLTDALIHITAVGATFLPRLGTAFTDLMANFRDWARVNTDNGNMFRWVENGIQQFKYLGSSISGIFGIFGKLYEASVRAGGPQGLGGFATAIHNVSDALGTARWQDSLTAMFSGAYDSIRFMISGLTDLMDGFREFGPTLGTIMSLSGEAIGAILSSLGDFLAHPAVQSGMVNFFTSVKDSIVGLAPAMDVIGPLFGAVATMAGQLVEAIAGTLDAALRAVGPSFTDLSETLQPLIPALANIAQTIIEGAAPALNFILGIIESVAGVVVDAVSWLSQYDGAWRGIGATLGWVVAPILLVAGAVRGLTMAFSIAKIGITAFKWLFKPLGDLLNKILKPMGGTSGALSRIGGLLSRVGGFISKIFAPALRFLAGRFTILLGPIGWVVTAIGLLIPAVRYAWENFEWFRNGVLGVWNGIKNAAMGVAEWFTTTLVPWFQQAWDGIRGAASGVLNWFTGTLVPWFRGALSNVGDAFMGLYRNYVTPAWNGILRVIEVATIPIKILLGGLWLLVRDVIGPGFLWLYNHAVKPAFNWIVGAIRNAWENGIRPTFQWIADRARWLGDRFTDLRNWLGTVWQGIENRARFAYNWLNNSVFQPIGRAAGWLGDRMSDFRDRLGRIWQSIQDRGRQAYNWINDNVFRPISRAAGWLGDRFQDFRERISRIWQGVQDRLHDGWRWIDDNVFRHFRNGVDRLQKAFESAQKGIGTAWERLQDAVREPISFVVNKVINPFIGGYNDLNDFWSGDDLSEITGFATGGYTGPGRKYQPAGIVHAGEYVTRKESTSSIEKAAPGYLGSLNKYGAKALGNVAGYATGGKVTDPFKGRKFPLSQGYHAGHNGIDIAAPIGTPIYATADGTVTHAGPGARAPGVWGGTEIHVSGGGIERWFAHLSSMAVSRGERVKQGQLLGRTGNTGISSGPHLHFGVFRGGWPNSINPLDYLGGAIEFGADTGGGGSWIDPIGWIKDGIGSKFDFGGMIDKAKNMFAGNKFAQMGLGIGRKAIDGIIGKAASLADPVLNAFDAVKDHTAQRVSDVASRVKVEAWAMEALVAAGMSPGPRNVAAVANQARIESNYDPNAVNNWDINAKNGTPSRGIMQVIGPTFNAHAMPGRNNILDPVDNMIAAIRYANSRYGNIRNIWPTTKGYANGGLVKPTLYDGGGLLRKTGEPQLIQHKKRKPDAVLTASQWRDQRTLAKNVESRQVTGTDGMELHVHAENASAEDVARRGIEDFTWQLREQMGV